MEDKPIVVNPQIMGGKPVIRGTRVTVERVLNLLAQGLSTADLQREYPFLQESDIRACLAYGASLAGDEEIVPLSEGHSA